MSCRLFEYLQASGLNFPVIHHIDFPKAIDRWLSIYFFLTRVTVNIPIFFPLELWVMAFLFILI